MKFQLLISKRFKKQYRRLSRSGDKRILLALDKVINILISGEVLPSSNRNHWLAGDLKDFCECHVLPDWLLIYRKHEDILILELLATGTHSELFR